MSFGEKFKAPSIWLAWLLQMFQMNIGNEHEDEDILGETWEVQLKYIESDNYFWVTMFINPAKWIIQ